MGRALNGGNVPWDFSENRPPGLLEGVSPKVLSLRETVYAKLEFSEDSLSTPSRASPAYSFFTDHILQLISVLRLCNTKYTKT